MRIPKGPRASSFSATMAMLAFGLSLAALVACSKPAISSTMNIPRPKPLPTATCPNPRPEVQVVKVTVDSEHHAVALTDPVEVPPCTDAKIVWVMKNHDSYRMADVKACKAGGYSGNASSSGVVTIIDHNTDPKAKGTWYYRITATDVRGQKKYMTKDLCSQDPPPSIHNY